MEDFLAAIKAFFVNLLHSEAKTLQPIVAAAVSNALTAAPAIVEAGLTGGNAIKVAGAALTEVGEQALVQGVAASTETAMVLVQSEIKAQTKAA